MNTEAVAERFDNRAGYRLVAYGPVGLPVFRINSIGLCLARKNLDPIEEFVLRGVAAGADSIGDIAGLLGLEHSVIESCLAELIRNERIRVAPEGTTARRRIELTEKGREVAASQEAIVPSEQTVVFCVDGLTRQAKFYPREVLSRPRDMKDAGIPEVRAFPARPPELSEIDVRDVADVLRLEAGRAEAPKQLLRLNRIEKRQRLFLDAVALAYRAEVGGQPQVAFAVDGRLSVEHEAAFARANGIEKSKTFRGLFERVAVPDLGKLLGGELAQEVERIASSQRDPAELQRNARSLRSKRSTRPPTDGQEQAPKAEAEKVGQELKRVEDELAALPVRQLAVYEHPPLLKSAVEEAERRLLIISPWIRRSVVDGGFVRQLRKALGRGVQVFIGFGLGEFDDGERPWDRQAREELEDLASRSAGFSLKRLGDTHAKILIKDGDYLVTSSFNWLSFRGDPHRTFREEWGTMVSIAAHVDQFFDRMVERFGED